MGKPWSVSDDSQVGEGNGDWSLACLSCHGSDTTQKPWDSEALNGLQRKPCFSIIFAFFFLLEQIRNLKLHIFIISYYWKSEIWQGFH